MDVREIGEFGLLERIAHWVKEGGRAELAGSAGIARPSLCLGIGDDAAAWQAPRGVELWTTDTMVEGVHFLRGRASWADVGWKLVAANVSDIAAMGGCPSYALVTLGLPEGTQVEEVEGLYQGMLALANQEGVVIAGGDLVRSPVFFATVALAGVAGEALMTRSSARPGDLVATSGYPGLSGGGLRLMLGGVKAEGPSPEIVDMLQQAHLRPQPQVALGQRLIRAGVRAAIDTSDGLLADLSKLCLASGVAAQVERERLPLHPVLQEVFSQDYWEVVFGGGEDYQLVFTAPPTVMQQVTAAEGSLVSVIGQVVAGEPGRVTVVDASGQDVTPPRGGWDHFRP